MTVGDTLWKCGRVLLVEGKSAYINSVYCRTTRNKPNNGGKLVGYIDRGSHTSVRRFEAVSRHEISDAF